MYLVLLLNSIKLYLFKVPLRLITKNPAAAPAVAVVLKGHVKVSEQFLGLIDYRGCLLLHSMILILRHY